MLDGDLLAALSRMRLPYLRAAAPEVLATARAQRWDPAEVVKVLLHEEIRGRDEATRRMRRKSAALPAGKTFASWRETDSSIPPGTQTGLATLKWIGRAENLAVAGPSGTGKSHFVVPALSEKEPVMSSSEKEPVMSSTTGPDSTPITGENIAASQEGVRRLQGGGLRFLDAHEIQQQDFNVVTRPFQNNTTQHWRLTNVGGNVYTIVQVSSGRFLDAHEIQDLNFRVVTRPQQNNDTQRWRLFDFGGGFFTIQQVSSGRFLEATLDGDFQVVTRPESGSDQQTWRLGDV